MNRQSLSGWGRTAPTVADVATPATEDDVVALVAHATAIIPRGLGRSYGDAAQLSGGLVLDNRGLTSLSPITPDGVVRVGAGVSYDELLDVAMPLGWFVPVSPGTRQVTMGGAVAADVHGKNHHVDGAFGRHVVALRLVTPTGVRDVTPDRDADLFWATLGGLGLTGVVTEVTLQLMPIATDQVLVIPIGTTHSPRCSRPFAPRTASFVFPSRGWTAWFEAGPWAAPFSNAPTSRRLMT